ncbi:hypothetical protein [Zhihengliuella halotolerans]|uniref:Uncharacterized protein n=1 Tax=Zhihengliuella halotolerans TaxID=370736 RepID=A0A4Q8ACZ5_9MICC|nr:hypothetical protein [Zhihengliuella halotolerans]RZU61389.1 hypothetical protein EV380_0958 [Zhihengliuella halotolerans]
MMWAAWSILILVAGLALFTVLRTWRPSTKTRRTPLAIALAALLALAAGVGVLGDALAAAAVPLALAVVVSVAAATLGGGPVAEAMFRWASFKHDGGALLSVGEPRVLPARGSEPEDGGAVLRGGLWIGLLERGAIASALWAGWPEGLAIVLAVKGLGRFTELKQHAAAEQFILGTFASVLWACAAYGVGRLVAG